jgi:hypothetical protein
MRMSEHDEAFVITHCDSIYYNNAVVSHAIKVDSTSIMKLHSTVGTEKAFEGLLVTSHQLGKETHFGNHICVGSICP